MSLLPWAMMALAPMGAAAEPVAPPLPLDGAWRLCVDPRNEGRDQKWWAAVPADTRPAPVPGILQESFPGYHGVVWYYRELTPAANPHPGGRSLLRFGAADYLAEVWLNGTPAGGHEGGETPFELDVTAAVRPGETNLLAVRLLNPTNEPIDGITLSQTAHRCKVVPFSAGGAFDSGGLVGSVELAAVPATRLTDLHLSPAVTDGVGRLSAAVTVHHSGAAPVSGTLELSLAPASSGATLTSARTEPTLQPGDNVLKLELSLPQPRLWQVNDPQLYRAVARWRDETSTDERSARFGWRDFRFDRGCFRLNGRRIYLRSTHTCNHFPVGLQLPHDPDLVRRDLLNLKVMGFNMVRFIWGAATPEQLDFCDEVGLLVYEESYASQPLADSPHLAERFDANVSELIRRDRQHPSVVIWGLLNEAPDGPAFRHAVAMLPLVRGLDPSRVVFLNSGRYDNVGMSAIAQVAGLAIWPKDEPCEPWVARNVTADTIRALGITWPAGHLALHPGPAGEYSVVRFTAPRAGTVELEAVFTGLAERATTDVHVLHSGKALFDDLLNLNGRGNQARYAASLALAAGDTVDLVAGYGNGSYGADTTGLSATFRWADGQRHDATEEFSTASNPHGPWSYGRLLPGPQPDAASFGAYPTVPSAAAIGSLCNPGSTVWEDVFSDRHVYPRVPHTAEVITTLRTLSSGEKPVFLTEYGIGSAVDLWRAVRHFEQIGATEGEDSQFLTAKLNQFLADYQAWHLDDTFPRPEDFFAASLRKMAGQRTLGLNAIRANPHVVGHSLTGAIDHVWCGEGLTTLFRELKPGTVDALYDAWYPLRWCLFAEPAHLYRGLPVHLEAVLANEDALGPGDYPVRLQVTDPDGRAVLDRTVTLTVPGKSGDADPPLVLPCFDERVTLDGPAGRYRFTATFERGAAAAGGVAEFDVTDAADMPAVPGEVTLLGDDGRMARWLTEHGTPNRPYAPTAPEATETILVCGRPADPATAFPELAGRLARGSTAVFLDPSVFAEGDQPLRWLPLAGRGTVTPLVGWLYLRDEWAKRHPIFDGLPAGGLMDYGYYRELIPDLLLMGQEPPAEAVAGAIKASQDYAAGLTLAVWPLGAGRFVVTTLRIRENLGGHPAAERLLRNLLNYAAPAAGRAPQPLPADWDEQLRRLNYK